MLNITKGKIDRALKVVAYGSEGIGKTTFAAAFPEPLFIDTEGGTAHMDVRRIDRPQSWEELLSIVNEVAADPNVCKTLVLDTADWAEALCVTHVCQKYKQNSIESFGYGKGYTYLAEEFSRLFSALDAVIASGKHVVITAHAKMRKFEQPDEQGAYDRWEMKLSKQIAPLLKEWCDIFEQRLIVLGVDAGELRSTVLFKERLDLGRESGSALFTEDCSDFLQRQFLFGSRCRCLRLCINSRLILQHGICHSLNAVRQ